mgnify:CR=1 FL=1
MPIITLPDGSQRSFDHPVSVLEVAQSIGAGLAKATLAGKVNGKQVDACDVIDSDVTLQIITPKDENMLSSPPGCAAAPEAACAYASEINNLKLQL